MGAYSMSNAVTVRTNSLFGKGTRDLPKFQAGPRYIEVYHREYIKDIVGSQVGVDPNTTVPPSAFLNENFSINPGLAPTPGAGGTNGLFPWLSTIASQFETYQFMGLALEFVSTCGEMNATQGGLGTVVQVVEYNALNPAFTSKEAMMNYDAAVSAKPTISALCGVECSPNDLPSTHLYVRSGLVPANADERLYDLGNYQIATQSLPNLSMPVGELWVTYHVRLYQPKLAVSPLGDGLWAYSEITGILNTSAAHPSFSAGTASLAADCMIGGLYGFTGTGTISNDADNPVDLRVECKPSGFNLPGDPGEPGPPSVNYIWRVIGAAVAVGRTVEIQLVWNCGQTAAQTASLSPALAQQYFPPGSIKKSNTMLVSYPMYPAAAVPVSFPFGFVTRWLVTIPTVWLDEDTQEPYIPIVFHNSSNGAQGYNGNGNWASVFSLSVDMYKLSGSEDGPISYPYVGPGCI